MCDTFITPKVEFSASRPHSNRTVTSAAAGRRLSGPDGTFPRPQEVRSRVAILGDGRHGRDLVVPGSPRLVWPQGWSSPQNQESRAYKAPSLPAAASPPSTSRRPSARALRVPRPPRHHVEQGRLPRRRAPTPSRHAGGDAAQE